MIRFFGRSPHLLVALAVLIMALVLAALPAFSQQAPPCNTHASIMAMLKVKYGEDMTRQAISQAGTVVIWTENAATRTWSVVEARPDGMTCLLNFGPAFEIVTPPPPGEPG